MGKKNPSMPITKVDARNAIERVPELRSGVVDMKNSLAGYCTDPRSENYGKVWTLLSLQNGEMVQYSGFADETLRKQRVSLGANDDADSKRHKLLTSRDAEGYQDLNSKALPMKSWSAQDDVAYRGKKKSKKKKSKKKSQKASKKKMSKKFRGDRNEEDEQDYRGAQSDSSDDDDLMSEASYRGKKSKCSKKKKKKSCKRSKG